MTYFIIYRTTNTINGRYYIGKRKSEHPDAGSYLGSGKALKVAIKKYGKEAFTKEILHQCTSFDEMNELEKQLVNEAVLLDPLSYNMKIGGTGGRGRGWTHSQETRDKISASGVGRPVSAETRENKSRRSKGRVNVGKQPWNTGGTIPTHQKKIISERMKNTIIINDGNICRRIPNTEEIPDGWKKGRLLK